MDVIQERPVSKSLLVEGQEILSSAQPRVADGSVEESSIFSSAVEDNLQSALGEGPTSNVSSGKQPPFLLELFCGTAGVCAQFRTLGGRALGIDHHLKRTKLKAAAVKLDLTQQWVQNLIEREIKLKRVSALHMGPPCGTASKARNIPIKRKLRSRGAPNPQPLRSSAFPLGFPWLKGLNKIKVDAANSLYGFASRVAELCDEHDVFSPLRTPITL